MSNTTRWVLIIVLLLQSALMLDAVIIGTWATFPIFTMFFVTNVLLALALFTRDLRWVDKVDQG